MLRRQGANYHFRRRVPGPVRPLLRQSEVWVSLRTTDRRAARATAAGLYALTEDVFAAMTEKPTHDPVAAAEKLKATLDEYVKLRRENGIATAMMVGRYHEAQAGAETMKQVAMAALTAGSKAEPPPAAPASVAPVGPTVTELLPDFLQWKATQGNWTAQTGAQTEATIRLLTELVGNKPLPAYTRQDAASVYDDLLKMPSNHGKTKVVEHACEAIARAERTKAKTLALKTVKRHFSAYAQLWKWAIPRGEVSANIWSGFSFPGTTSTKSKRDVWKDEDLDKIFHNGPYAAPNPLSAEFWLPLIALFSGMRLEEIARLRSGLDICRSPDGIWYFDVQEQAEPSVWSPKTEAGARRIPIHPELIRLGLPQLAEYRQALGSIRLFPELRPSGRDKKLGAEYSKKFGRFKKRLGFGPKHVFHSFRHTGRTLADKADVHERWVDGVFGHEGVNASEGRRTYNKETSLEAGVKVIETIRPNVDLSHLPPFRHP